MPLFQEVWSFKGLGGSRWNEVHYTVQGSLAAAAAFSPSFVSKRLALLHEAYTWSKVRVTQVSDPSVHVLVNINQPGLAVAPATPANPGEAAIINFGSSVRSGSRRLWLRGLAEGSVAFSGTTGQSQLGAGFGPLLNTWIAAMSSTGSAYAIKIKKKGIGNGIQKTRVTTVDGTAANGTCTLLCKEAPLVVVGDYVEITRAEPKLFPGLKGPFKVLNVVGMIVTVQYRVPQDELIVSGTTMLAKLSYWEDALINPAISGFSYAGVRRTKNDGTGSRGARRAQRLRG